MNTLQNNKIHYIYLIMSIWVDIISTIKAFILLFSWFVSCSSLIFAIIWSRFWIFNLKWSQQAMMYRQQLTKCVTIAVIDNKNANPQGIWNNNNIIYQPNMVDVSNGQAKFTGMNHVDVSKFPNHIFISEIANAITYAPNIPPNIGITDNHFVKNRHFSSVFP